MTNELGNAFVEILDYLFEEFFIFYCRFSTNFETYLSENTIIGNELSVMMNLFS
jgi:hypothetical protein